MAQDFYFLLLPGFSSMGFISAIEPLRVANRFRGELYRWHVLSSDGGAVPASNGMSVNAEAALEGLNAGATLLVVAFIYVGANLLVDILYAFLDPRIRYE